MSALEMEIRDLLGRLGNGTFECPCRLAKRVGWTPRQTFESLAQLWVDGRAEHIDDRWRTTGDTTP